MFDEYLEPPRAERPVHPAQAVQAPVNSVGTPSSTTIDKDAPSLSISLSASALQSHILHQDVAAKLNYKEDNTVALIDNNPFVNVFALEPHSEASSSGDISLTKSTYVSQTLHHLNKWSKDHQLDNVIGNPSRSVSTRKQLVTDALWCLYSSVLSKVEPKNFKSAITEDCWFQAMQDKIHEFDRLYQASPTKKHIEALKRVFRYLKGTINWGLWYPKDTAMALTAYADIDHVVQYDKTAGCYRCQLDEQWFVLTKDTLREALQITPVNNNQAFISPPLVDALINFVNELGYHKLNLSRHTSWKKKATLIVISSIRFTKLIIHHLQRRHNFHPRPDSPLHLPNEEPVLRYLKFSAKGTKREFFGMPIPGSLITADIQEALYYQEYLANVAKHQRYLAGETGSDSDSPAPKPTKPARKPRSTAPKAPPRPSVSTSVTSAQPAPTSAPTRPQEKKRKLTTETSDKPSKAKKKSKYGFVGKNALEESMKSMYDVPRGPLLPVVIREPMSEKYQPLLEVPRKGKAKVTEEQVSHDLLSLQKPKKKSPVDQYIFQRCTSTPTGSFGHNESTYAELGKSDSEEESKKVVTGADEGGQDPGNAGAEELYMPSHVVHAGSDRKHMDLDVADVSPQPLTEQIDEGFTATAYPKVQENLKLTVEEQVLNQSRINGVSHNSARYVFNTSMTSPIIDLTSRPESPKVHQQFKATTTETTTTTTTTLPPPSDQQQSTTEAMMMKRIDVSHQVSKAVSEVFTKAVDWAMQAPLQNRFRDLPEPGMKEILHQRMWETESYKFHKDHMQLYEALEKSMNRDHSQEVAQDLSEVRKKKKKSRESSKTPPGSPPHQPPPPPPPTGPSKTSGALGASGSSQVPPSPPPPSSTDKESQSKGSAAPSSLKTAASAEYQAWTTTDIRLMPSISLTPVDLEMDEDMALDEQAQSSVNEDIRSAHIPKASTLASNYSPPPEDSLIAQTGDIAAFMDCVDDPILRYNVSKPLPLGGPPGQVTIQTDFFFNKYLDYLRYGSKGIRPALFIPKMKAVYYPNDGLEKWYQISFGLKRSASMILLQCHLNHLPPKDKKILTTAINQWTRHLVIRQPVEDFQLGIESYQTQLNLTKPQWDTTGFKYKHDYIVIDFPRAVMFRDRYEGQGVQDQQDESMFKYEVLDHEGCRSEQGVHVRHSEAVKDKEDLPQFGELC
nr:integrase, catalytic region, zinc finger, CCHC-type, peptidase aspartic, catalytic [Tanacetum cinerariifolium]